MDDIALWLFAINRATCDIYQAANPGRIGNRMRLYAPADPETLAGIASRLVASANYMFRRMFPLISICVHHKYVKVLPENLGQFPGGLS
jgi:hypothetical protein